MTGAGAKSCEHCAKRCQYTPASECRHYDDVHGAPRWLCDPCAQAGAPLLKAEPDFGPAPDNGTETSKKSARETDERVTAQCYTVLGVIAAAGPEGLIREEIYPLAEITNSAACGRLNTLKAKGLVVVDGERRAATTRKTQQVYRLAIYAKMRAAA